MATTDSTRLPKYAARLHTPGSTPCPASTTSLADFGNPIVLAGNFDVLSTKIFFAVAGAQHDPGRAAALASVLLGLMLVAFWLQQRWIGNLS